MIDTAEDPRITRARLSGPSGVTKDATVAIIGPGGKMTILAKGTNEWVCTPGDENKIGQPPMCMNPMGMQWMMDAMQGKPKPTNAIPGMIYMLCGATQRSNTDPSDMTSPAIPIGPSLDGHLALRCRDDGSPHYCSGQGRMDHVRWYAICVPSCVRRPMGR